MSNFNFINIDTTTASIAELEQEIKRLVHMSNIAKNQDIAIKLILNQAYGAIANKYFVAHNPDIAEAITLQGQDLIKFSESILNKYFHEFWHKDLQVHKKLGVTNVKRVVKPVTVYGDTDSCDKSSVIYTETESIRIENLFINESKNNLIEYDNRCNEIIKPKKLKVLNYTSDKSLYFAGVKRIIRHRVTKAKWKLKTKSGREVVITNDHSLVVFRDGIQMTIKPNEVNIKTDKILSIIKNEGIKK